MDQDKSVDEFQRAEEHVLEAIKPIKRMIQAGNILGFPPDAFGTDGLVYAAYWAGRLHERQRGTHSTKADDGDREKRGDTPGSEESSS